MSLETGWHLGRVQGWNCVVVLALRSVNIAAVPSRSGGPETTCRSSNGGMAAFGEEICGSPSGEKHTVEA